MQNELLKRLEIIKNAVAMEEDELIDMQLTKLQLLELDDSVQQIVKLIETHQFEHVIQKINQYKQDNSRLSVYEDPQIQGLKLQLKKLEEQLNDLTDERADIEQQINHFNSEYALHLGDIIEEILKLRVDTAKDKDRQEAEEAYESFKNQHQEQLKNRPNQLTDEEKKKLKSLYRQASRLCHPDKLTDEFKEQGEDFFKALNEANQQQDLAKVEDILKALQTGVHLDINSDTIDDKALLREKISLLEKQIETLAIEIQDLEKNDVYFQIQCISDFSVYFSNLKQELEFELEDLQKKAGK